jgi:uncharacterized membrane protein/Mg-chelatase subunit ChlD
MLQYLANLQNIGCLAVLAVLPLLGWFSYRGLARLLRVKRHGAAVALQISVFFTWILLTPALVRGVSAFFAMVHKSVGNRFPRSFDGIVEFLDNLSRMPEYRVGFDRPWYLCLLVLLPLLWMFSYRSLAGLGPNRRFVAIYLRTLVLTMFTFAAAEMQAVLTSEKLTVIYLLDQSLSIPETRREAMIQYVNAAIREHRKQDDRAGVIVFGREPAIEIPPFNETVQISKTIESLLDPEYSNLAGAMKLAQASFPADASKRVVLVTDGNENLGDALQQARALAEAGVGIDVQPITYQARAEVAVEKVTLPSDVRKGQPFDLRVVVNNTTEPKPGDSGVVRGRLIISQTTDDQPIVISEQEVELPPGKRVFTLRQKIDTPHFYTYDARFVPNNPADDAMPQNNRATTFTHVRGSGQVLLLEDYENRGEHEAVVAALRQENLEVTIRPSNQLPNGLPELQQYDTVILANVPREHFSDQQITMLVLNTQNMGSGLVMLGGPNSFGAGGWSNTEIEKAMPVDFQIKSAKVVPKGALALLMHASEMPEGNHWQKVVAQESIKALGGEDYCGLLHWNGTDQWLWGNGLLKVGGNRDKMLAYIDRMVPGDMPDFDPGMVKAQQAFARITDAAAKHMIIISDGDPSPPTAAVIQGLKTQNVTVTTVAVGCHGVAEFTTMKRIAQLTGGKYYEVTNARALPRIYQKEARRVARPLVFEDEKGFVPRIKYPHEMLGGIEEPLPPLTGFVQTTVKQSPLVEVALVSPVPAGEENATILASWTYGLGKSVVFTSDAGERWAKAWTTWDNYEKLFSQMVRWSMRPSGETGKFTVATDVSNGQVKMFVTALDNNDEFLNFLNLSGEVFGPDMKPRDVKLEQTAPGRYVGVFDAKDAGSYFMIFNPGAGRAPIRAGVDVPYSDEFRDRQADTSLLTNLVHITPKNGAPGAIITDATGGDQIDELLKVNTFRHDLAKATSNQDIWYYLLWLAAGVFFFDIFIRRVTVNFAWLPPLAAKVRDKILRRESALPATEYMQRLRTKKDEVSQQLEQKRAAVRFEPLPDQPVNVEVIDEQLRTPLPSESKPKPSEIRGMAPDQAKEDDNYTSRLLKAKKKVWEDRDQK